AFRNKFFPAIPLRFIRPKKISRSPPDICTGPCSFTPSRRTALKRVKVISRGQVQQVALLQIVGGDKLIIPFC
ncbi:hypothetical protein ACV0NU_005370, partial [Klebsiella pneumoniae]